MQLKLPLSSSTRLSLPRLPRWVAVAFFFVLLALLGQWSVQVAERPQRLGVRPAERDRQVILSWVQPAGLAWDGGARPGDRVVSVDGGPLTATTSLASVTRASSLQLQSPSGLVTVAVSATPRFSRGEDAALLGIAACFALVGGAVFILADGLAAGVTFAFTVAGAVMLTAAVTTPVPSTASLALLYVVIVGFGASTLLLFLVFPIDRLRGPAGRVTALATVALSVVLIGLYARAVLVDSASYVWLKQVTFATLALDLLGAGVLTILALVGAAPQHRQARGALGLLALGAVVGLAPFLCLVVLPELVGIGYVLPPQVAILGVVLLPISLGAAVVSRQFLAIRRLIRRGVVAVIVWTLLSAVIGALLALLDWWLQRMWSASADRLARILVIAALGSLIWPCQRWLRRVLERTLFHDVYDYASTLRRLSGVLAQPQRVEAIADTVLADLCATLDLAWATITLDDLAEHYHTGNDPAGAMAFAVPLVIDGDRIGVFAVGPKRHDVELLDEDRELIATLVPMMATALRNTLLLRTLAAQVATLAQREQALSALSARLLQVQEDERKHLARELHDDPLQRAIFLAREISEDAPAGRLRTAVEEIIASVRAICVGLRPPALDDFGLEAGLEALVNEIRARSDLTVTLTVDAPNGEPFGRLEIELEAALYRVAQEALTNCLKHAQAQCIQVRLARTSTDVRLQVTDDGHGLRSTANGGGAGSHLGLLGMRERLQPWDGCVRVDSSNAVGLVVSAMVPWQAP